MVLFFGPLVGPVDIVGTSFVVGVITLELQEIVVIYGLI